MTTRPWMPLNVADYLRDTAHLRALESGSYLHLIMAYWVGGGLPNDDRQLATIAKLSDREWKAIKPTIAAFFGEGFSSHKRIDKELAKAAEISNKRRSAVEQREIKRRSNDPSSDDTLNTSQSKKDGASAPPIDPDADLFRRGVEVLGPDGRSLIARLKKTKGGSIPHTRAAIEQASTKANPREYIGRIVNGAAQSDNDFRTNPTAGSLI